MFELKNNIKTYNIYFRKHIKMNDTLIKLLHISFEPYEHNQLYLCQAFVEYRFLLLI